MKKFSAVALVASSASAFVLKRNAPSKTAHLDSFDCYNGGEDGDDKTGKNYVGLRTRSASGRTCANWLSTPVKSGKGIGNHNYCRNPDGGMDTPYCYVVDSTKEGEASTKEACEVPVCKASTLNPEKWIAPVGTGGKSADAGPPCEHTPPPTKNYKLLTSFTCTDVSGGGCADDSNRSCMAKQGDKMWLIGQKLSKAADVDECSAKCVEKAGAEFMTFFGKEDEDGNNCGCYRDACVPTPKDLTINQPTSYKLGSFPDFGAGGAGASGAGPDMGPRAAAAAGASSGKQHGSSTGMSL